MMMDTIQRQYDEVVASHYDLDPQSVTGDTLDRAAEQIRKQLLLDSGQPVRVYDVGMGTGMFLARLKRLGGDRILPFGLDLSSKMIASAFQKLPDLAGAVDTAENLDAHFPGQSFDLISTHFITGFVPLEVLAPKIHSRLEVGGYWSYVGATMSAYPTLQAKANNALLRWWFGGGKPLDLNNKVTSPANRQEIFATLERHGFVVRQCETFQPKLVFNNMDEFLDYTYWGGWLTPYIESIGLHKVGPVTRFLLNRLFFPMTDHHSIEIHLAQKVSA
jgi:SAM-dependent methyltransferase